MQRELSKNPGGKFVEATLPPAQSVNTERSIRPQAVALWLAAVALLVGVPAGIACGRLCWQVFAYQLGITPVVAVPLAALPIMAASWLAAAAVIAALSGKTATRNPRPECCTASSPPASHDLVSHRSHCPLSRHSLMPAIPLP